MSDQSISQDDVSICSLITTSTDTTLNNTGTGRTLGIWIYRGGKILERTLSRLAIRVGHCPRAIERRLQMRLDGHEGSQPCTKICKDCNTIQKDTLLLIRYVRSSFIGVLLDALYALQRLLGLYHVRFARFISPRSVDTIRASSHRLDSRRTSAQDITIVYNLVYGILDSLEKFRNIDDYNPQNQLLAMRCIANHFYEECSVKEQERFKLDEVIDSNFDDVLDLVKKSDISAIVRNQTMGNGFWDNILQESRKSLPLSCTVSFNCESIMATLSLSITVVVHETSPTSPSCSSSYSYSRSLDVLFSIGGMLGDE